MIRADVIFIGYRRAGTNFIVNWLRNHPQINHDDQQVADLIYYPGWKPELIDKPKGKIWISCDEGISESVCITGKSEVWGRHLYHPGAFNLVRYDVIIDPAVAVALVKSVHPNAKILMVIRDQVDWFASLYKSTVSSLPPRQRTFHDWWITPDGIACRLAGYHDRVIRAWSKEFSDVLVIRSEELSESSERLCQWLNVDHVPFAQTRENESHAGLARLHRYLPISKLPLSVKSSLQPLVKFLPGKKQSVISDEERAMIVDNYKRSNERTKALLG